MQSFKDAQMVVVGSAVYEETTVIIVSGDVEDVERLIDVAFDAARTNGNGRSLPVNERRSSQFRQHEKRRRMDERGAMGNGNGRTKSNSANGRKSGRARRSHHKPTAAAQKLQRDR